MKLVDLINLLQSDLKYKHKVTDSISESIKWGISVALILFLFRPFGLSDSSLIYLFTICLGYGTTTFSTFFFNLIITKNFIYKISKQTWKIQNELLLFGITVIINTVFNFLYSSIILNEFPFSCSGFLRLFAYTSSILIFVFVIKNAFVLFVRYNSEKTMLETKVEYYKELKNVNQIKDEDETLIKLTFGNEELALQLKRIFLISAWGNYIKILLDYNDKKMELVKRGRIKDVEQQLMNYPDFQKCHRSYIVNVNYIARKKGNAKKTVLLLKSFDITVPVAREKIKDFSKFNPK